jgi:hypothetical protein
MPLELQPWEIKRASEKRSKPIKVHGVWRILRHDGVPVGWYETKKLAIRAIATEAWLR